MIVPVDIAPKACGLRGPPAWGARKVYSMHLTPFLCRQDGRRTRGRLNLSFPSWRPMYSAELRCGESVCPAKEDWTEIAGQRGHPRHDVTTLVFTIGDDRLD